MIIKAIVYLQKGDIMPLIILGLIVLICILIYAISDFIKDNKKEPKAPKISAKIKRNDDESRDENNTLLFPTENVETEKKKRNIH